jgi:hypothetical protein
MTVWCRQTTEGEPAQSYVIEPHFDAQTDAELLAAKLKGARDKGWAVKRTGPTSFTAVKVRWGGASCVREFWSD